MPKVPREVAGFVALPVTLKSPIASLPSATHYIYIKPHEPRIPDEDTPRSLFLVNIPVTTSELHLRHLFATQLSAGRIERVEFSPENALQDSTSSTQSTSMTETGRSSRKRKRNAMTADELESGLDSFRLPETLPGPVHPSGSTAIAVFVDRPSMEMSLKAARKATRQGSNAQIVWGEGLDEKAHVYGIKRYEAHKSLQYPPRATLLKLADDFMTAYTEMEEARTRENAKKRQLPDEDGFVTVTRGAKGGTTLKKEEAEELKEKQKAKEKGLEDFYRFQMREKRKEQQGELLRKFEEDKRKVAEMRKRRGKLKPER